MTFQLLYTAVILAAVASIEAQSFDRIGELEAAIAAEMETTKTPGVAISIIRGDKVVYARGFGTTSVEGGSPVTADTLFRIGSTTKMFTAAAFAVLADQGKAKFDAKVSSYVSGLPPKVDALTPHQLMSQSSGLRDMNTAINSDDDAALALNVAGWKDDAFFSEPNAIYSYSSANFWLTGLIVEKLHGKPYADSMNELLFQPLGMKRSFLRPREAMTYPLALGHNRQGTTHTVNRPAANNAAIYPGGSIFSSVNDVSRWAIAMLNGGMIDGKQAIPRSVIENLTKPQFYLPGEEKVFYGYGVMGYDIRGVKTISHGGVSRGYGATIFFAPEQKVAVIVLTNSNGQTFPKTRNKANEIMLPLQPEQESPVADTSVKAGELEKFIGRFVHVPQTWEIKLRDQKLFVESEGKEFELKKSGNNEFSYEQGQILFVANAKGEFEHIFMGLYAARRI